MTAPTPQQFIQGQGTVSADNLNTFVQTVTNITQLRSLIGLPGMQILLEGTVTPGDGGQGTFYWNATSIGPDNGTTIIVPQTGVPGAWLRLTSFQLPFLTVEQFGAIGNGIVDDTAAINAALAAATPGQQVWLGQTSQYLVDSNNIIVPPGVILYGPWNVPGSIELMHPAGNSFSLAGLNGAIILNSAFSIILKAGSQIRGVPIYRQGLTIPVGNSNAFSGTAIIGQGDDQYIGYCLILGFNQGISVTNVDRTKIEWVFGDNQNGISVSTEFDVARIENCHQWPFCTYISGVNSGAGYLRTGTAYSVSGCALPVLIDNFAFAYFTGFSIINCGGPTLVACIADGISGISGSTAFMIGNSTQGDTAGKFIGCTAFSLQSGFTVNLPVSDFVEFIGCSSSTQTSSWNIVQGDARIIGGAINGATTGINVESINSTVVVSAFRVENLSGSLVNNSGASPNIIVSDLDLSQFSPGTTISTNMVNKIIASSSNIGIPSFGYFFNISGTTTISTITGGWVGRQIVLLFLNTVSITDGVFANEIRLNNGATFSAVEGSTLSLISNGTQWFQTGAST